MNKYEFILIMFLFLFFAQLYAEERYLELGASYSLYNKVHTLHGFDTADLVLENGETVEYSKYSESTKKYNDYDWDYGDKTLSTFPSFGLYGRVGFFYKEKRSKDLLDFNVGLGYNIFLGYEDNSKNWKSYKFDNGIEIAADNGFIGIGFKAVLILRSFSSNELVVDSYHVDDTNKRIYPAYSDDKYFRSASFGLGIMLFSAKIPYINSRLYCDSVCSLGYVGKSKYTYINDGYVRIGLLYAIW